MRDRASRADRVFPHLLSERPSTNTQREECPAAEKKVAVYGDRANRPLRFAARYRTHVAEHRFATDATLLRRDNHCKTTMLLRRCHDRRGIAFYSILAEGTPNASLKT